ncbi:hypothetical protein HanXRQr2_Chr13g0610391 [Helianthus annuus]|uniref:Uncharacterized protein n=1 Tax=Helianthus annuus TaxID=4232 RepID=A0A9K3HE52_HELAN|nr:hypothetical protein HanXRQr2_Chr13g0610391 [Helianthus annuus]KAJ0483222.1 hypothetical protein HanIR_Chr13g0662541 [Helianthus annuus]KAJ0499349.1 hypothetical protein HanHA89_Chr13g0533121 [Helianthus annuus]KAJ0665369.1 hypothetical protein HanLR1_Chr13g0503211 [Helianthus annuus]
MFPFDLTTASSHHSPPHRNHRFDHRLPPLLEPLESRTSHHTPLTTVAPLLAGAFYDAPPIISRRNQLCSSELSIYQRGSVTLVLRSDQAAIIAASRLVSVRNFSLWCWLALFCN